MKTLLLLPMACLFVSLGHAADPPSDPPELVLTAACFSDKLHDPEWIFVIGSIAYRSFDALKEGIPKLPSGITLKWCPTDVRIGGEPLSKEAEVMELKALCAKRGISLKIVPAG